MTKREKEEMEILRSDNQELAEAINSLKFQIGGYKSSHGNYRKQIAEFKSQIEHFKVLCNESDHLYEEKIAECDALKAELKEARNIQENTVPMTKFAELQQSIESKNEFIDSLQGRVQGLMMEKAELKNKVASLTEEQIELYNTIKYLNKPWWKRMFLL